MLVLKYSGIQSLLTFRFCTSLDKNIILEERNIYKFVLSNISLRLKALPNGLGKKYSNRKHSKNFL